MTDQPLVSLVGPGARVHIIGIGGAGMSAIARVLTGRGLIVSGSDRASGAAIDALRALGVMVFEGHTPENIRAGGAQAQMVIISSAVHDDNPEVLAARAANIPVLRRREALPALMGNAAQIAIAGTHGKTTTTAMVAHILRAAGRDPSYIVGGVMLNTGDNAHAGSGDAFVIEADEYDYMFLGLTPTIAVITNIEHDHPDMFPTLNHVMDAFRQFVWRIPEYDGVLVACADDPGAAAIARERRAAGGPALLYGLDKPEANWHGERLKAVGAMRVRGMQNGRTIQGRVRLPVAGDHNLRNALAALAAATAYGVPASQAMTALESFQGTERRCEIMGKAGGVTVISDYGHHPTAIRATLQAMLQRYQGSPIWVVWQPHTFSRTRILAAEFARAFRGAHHVLVTDIYAAREQPTLDDPNGASMARMIHETGHLDARYTGDLVSSTQVLTNEVTPGAVVLIFSAGDAPRIGEMLLAALQ